MVVSAPGLMAGSRVLMKFDESETKKTMTLYALQAPGPCNTTWVPQTKISHVPKGMTRNCGVTCHPLPPQLPLLAA